MSAVNHAWFFEDLVREMFSAANEGGAKIREISAGRGQLAAMKYLDYAWRNAVARSEHNPAVSSNAEVKQLARDLSGSFPTAIGS